MLMLKFSIHVDVKISGAAYNVHLLVLLNKMLQYYFSSSPPKLCN